MIKLLYVPTGNAFTLPDDEALRIMQTDRGNYKILEGGLQKKAEEHLEPETVDKSSDVEKNKYWEITDSYNDYKYSEGEQLSVQASKGDYSGYGEENLQRVYSRRIGQNKQANNANKGQRPENGKEERNSGGEPKIGDSIGELFSKHDGGRWSLGKTNEQPIGLKGIKKTTSRLLNIRSMIKILVCLYKTGLKKLKKLKRIMVLLILKLEL